MNQNELNQMMNCSVSGTSIQGGAGISLTSATGGSQYVLTSASQTNAIYRYDPPSTLWGFWQNYYYPQVIKESYPVYIQERAMDKGKQAFELLKALIDKKLLKVEKVSEFIEAMDTILNTL